jgi:hypothetical protein
LCFAFCAGTCDPYGLPYISTIFVTELIESLVAEEFLFLFGQAFTRASEVKAAERGRSAENNP